MKVTMLNTSDAEGGAARAAYRLLVAVNGQAIDATLRVLRKSTEDARVQGGAPSPSILAYARQRLVQRVRARRMGGWATPNPVLHSFGEVGAGIVPELNASAADVLHLHWIPGLLSVQDIGELRKPVLWTLHDMWAFCGGEHYAPDSPDARFRVGYRQDNRPAGESGPDLNRRAWEAKRRAWRHQRFTIVSPSRWLADCARHSLLLGDAEIHVIPNALDTETCWRPQASAMAREALGLPQQRQLILAGADGGVADPRKGGDLLRAALAEVLARQAGEVELVVYGQAAPAGADRWPCPVHWLGKVGDDRVLSLACSAADLMVVPSRQDNLPNTAVEAQACGTPVVAFDTGGLPDIVEHQHTGWLAKPFDSAQLADGICWLLGPPDRRRAISANARQRAVERFSPAVVAARYQLAYERSVASAARAGPGRWATART